MKKMLNAVLSIVCYFAGVVAAVYCGGYLMLLCPIKDLLYSFQTNTMTAHLLVVCIIKIALSTTVAGLVWCIGYIGYNHFIGTEDEYDRLLKQLEEEKKERKAMRKEAREARKLNNTSKTEE